MKKQAKKTAQKTLVKKASVKKTAIKKKKPIAIVKKSVSKKKVKFFKPLGIISAISGALGLVLLVSFSLANLLAPNIIDDKTVLGATDGLVAPTGFSSKVTNFRVYLSWNNMVDGDSQYLIWIYNSTAKKYYPETLTEGSGVAGSIITKSYDQTPGTTLLYRVSMCEGCQFTGENTVSGNVGSMSAGVAATVPKIPAPTSVRLSSNDAGVKLSWRSINGVDGYNVWRATSILGSYTKVGSVGTDGTFSSWHTYNADGTLGIPIDVLSPNTFTDETALPGKIYFYKISAKKMIAPLTYSKGWLNVESSRSSFKMIIPAKISAPKGFKISNTGATKMQVEVNVTASAPGNGYYLYCDKCDQKKMVFDESDYLSLLGYGDNAGSRSVFYKLQGLKQGTVYTFQLTKYRQVGSTNIEGAKTARISIRSGKDGVEYAPEVQRDSAMATTGDVANSVVIQILHDNERPADGYFVYCDSCETKKVKVSDLEFYGYGGRGMYGVLYMYLLKDVPSGTRQFQTSAYNEYNGKILEGPKSTTAYVAVP